jgi:hypothetical protein
MGLSNALGAAAHDAMRNRPLRHRPLQSPHSHHGRPPRLFAGWQAWLGQRFRQSQR